MPRSSSSKFLATALPVVALGAWLALGARSPSLLAPAEKARPHDLLAARVELSDAAFSPSPEPACAALVALPSSTPASPARTPPTPAPDEPALMAHLRALGETDPPLSLRLAREGNARMPQSLDAPERAWIVAKSLVNLQRFDEARVEGRRLVEAYRDTPWALDVERHLLVHPAHDSDPLP